jgi:hypothetical protein
MIRTLVSLAVCAALAGAAFADDQKPAGPNVAATGAKPAESNARLVFLAAELEDLGRAQKDSLLLINAARLYLKAIGAEVKRDAEREGGEGEKAAKGKLASVKDLVDLAQVHAQGNATILALIDELAVVSTKGNSGGAKFVRDSVPSQGKVSYKLEFYSQEFAEATVRGDGAGDIDLTVADENGNVICQSKGNRDREYCSWFPRWKGQFKVTVQNQGAGATNYRLYTN